MSIYSINIFVRWSVIQATKGRNVKIDIETQFSRHIIEIKIYFLSVHIPLVYVHLFYKYFVRRSVGQVTKGKKLRYLWMLLSLLISDLIWK